MKNSIGSASNLRNDAHAFATIFSKETLSSEAMRQVRGGDGGGNAIIIPPPPPK